MNLAIALQIPSELMADAPILRCDGETWSYAELERRSAAAAEWLTARGIGAGDTVATVQGFSSAFVALAFGTMAIGATIAPLNARVKADELRALLDGFDAQLLVHDERYEDLVTEACGDLPRAAGGEAASAGVPAAGVAPAPAGTGAHPPTATGLALAPTGAVAAATADARPAPLDPVEPPDDAVAILLHTSGTTGRPKPVPLTHDGLTTALLRTAAPADGTPRGATALAVPNHHVAGLVAMLTSVFGGRRIELLPRFSSADWLALVQESGADHAFVVPTMLQRIVADPALADTDLSALRLLAYGAAPMPRRVITEAMARFPDTCGFVGSYGQTETGGTVCVLGAEDHRAARDDDAAALERLGSIGRPLEGVELTILAEDGGAQPTGEVGEIAVRLPEREGDAWHRTGDLGRLDEGGYVFLTSRQDDLIIRAGENIDPAEIEDVLGAHPDVEEVAVAGLPDDEWGQIVAAFVVPKTGAQPSAEQLVAHVKRALASYKAPSHVAFVDALPRTAMGKIRRKELVAGALPNPAT